MSDQVKNQKSKIGRADLAENFSDHIKEIKKFSAEYGIPLWKGLHLYSLEPDTDKNTEVKDPIIDSMQRQGFTFYADPVQGRPSSRAEDVIGRNGNDNSRELGCLYLQELCDRTLSPKYAITRSDLEHPFDPETIGGLETDRRYRLRVKIDDVFASRKPIDAFDFQAPIVNSPTDAGAKSIGEDSADPIYEVDFDKKDTPLTKTSYRLAITDESMARKGATMAALAEVQIQKALQLENAIVNKGLAKLVVKATAAGASTEMTSKEVIAMFYKPGDMYMIDTIVGAEDAIVAYLDVDLTTNSGNNKAGSASRKRLTDRINDSVLVGKKTGVKGIGEKQMLVFDSGNGMDFVTNNSVDVQETYRDSDNARIVIRNGLWYAIHTRADADQATYLYTLS